jgi:phosphatidylinositol-3-phosphatase
MKTRFFLCLLTTLFAAKVFGAEGAVPTGIPRLDHVFVIMMENHGYSQLVGNPYAPFVNSYMNTANAATNYFAIGHPSSTNYLEVVGGSNFGVRSDNAPDWHNTACMPNLATASVVTDNPSSSPVCPIAGWGTDAETPAVDLTNECPSTSPCPPGLIDIDGVRSVPAAANTVGKTIADQLAERGMSWKSYQESLPPAGAENVNYSDGFFTDKAVITSVLPSETQTLIDLYAAKHDPFVYFRSVQEAENPGATFANIVGFLGAGGLYEDLTSGDVPRFSFIAPNQCNDQHGRGNAGPQCDYDPSDTGVQSGLNPALIHQGDLTLRYLVNAIHSSPAWHHGHNAIVILWDENDYSMVPNVNQVLTLVDTNYGPHGVKSNNFYTHFSLLRTIEGGLGLPCLNHACDENAHVMSDLFGGRR